MAFTSCCNVFHPLSALEEADAVRARRFGFDHWGSFPRGSLLPESSVKMSGSIFPMYLGSVIG